MIRKLFDFCETPSEIKAEEPKPLVTTIIIPEIEDIKETEKKDWLDYRDREKDEEGIIKVTDEELLNFPLTTIRCWKFNKFGTDCYTNDLGESDYCCPNCICGDLCHSQDETPLEKRYNELKPNKSKLGFFEKGVKNENTNKML